MSSFDLFIALFMLLSWGLSITAIVLLIKYYLGQLKNRYK